MEDLKLVEEPLKTLLDAIRSEDNFLSSLIDTIPPKAYFNQEVQEYLEEKKCSATDEQLKTLNIDNKMAVKGKQKRARLDPSQNQTVSQVMNELYANSIKIKKGKTNSRSKDASNIGDLQERLRARIEELQSARKRGPEGDKEAKQLRRKLSKIKKKKKGNFKKVLTNGASVSSEDVQKPTLSGETSSKKPVFNKDGKIVYSKFDLCAESVSKKYNKKDKMSKDNSTKNLKKALRKVKTDEKIMKELNAEDPDKAFQTANKQMWKKAIGKIEGIKMKDDPELLKKTIKKKEQTKKRSQKKWTERTDQVEQLREKKQEKRKANIQDRKKQKVDKKINRAKKKGRILPGF